MSYTRAIRRHVQYLLGGKEGFPDTDQSSTKNTIIPRRREIRQRGTDGLTFWPAPTVAARFGQVELATDRAGPNDK